MAAAQHTPSPWEVGFEDSLMGVPFIQIEADTRSVCEVSATHDDADNKFYVRDEDWANARLIAAAPDLLVQLKGLLGLVRFIINSFDIDAEQTTCVLRNNGEQVAEVPIGLLLVNAQDCIAKAEGA